MTNPALTADRILEVTYDLASVQAANPKAEDFTGFNNADYPVGLVLSQTGAVEECASLLYLYPRQVENYGITRDDLKSFMPKSESRNDARETLTAARATHSNKLGWAQTETGAVFQGVRLSQDVIKALKAAGAVRVSTGYAVEAKHIAAVTKVLGSQILNVTGLDTMIALTPQVTPEAMKVKAAIFFTVNGLSLCWTYSKTLPEFNQIKDVVKGFGPRYDGNGGWAFRNQQTLVACAVTLLDTDFSAVVDTTGLNKLTALATPATLELRDEIAAGAVVLHGTVTGANVELTIRKYDETFVAACKPVKVRYNPENNGWTVPVAALVNVVATLSAFPRFDFSKIEHLLPSAEAVKAERIFAATPTVTPTGVKMFPHQTEDVAFLVKPTPAAKNASKLLANDMGTGKTLSSLVAANYGFPTGRFLIVVPAVVKGNWRREIQKYIGADEKIQIVTGKSDVLDATARWTIINYDIISYYAEALMASKYDVAILDEAHSIKTYSSQRTKALIETWNAETKVMEPGILTAIPNVWTMSGTPVLNRMKELFTITRAIGHALGRSKNKFEEKYCGGHYEQVSRTRSVWVANGATNISDLTAKMAPVYRKVMKVDVLKDLPGKMRQEVEVELTAAEAKAYSTLANNLARAIEEAKMNREEGEESNGEVLRAITMLKMATAKIKIAHTITKVEEILEAGEKAVVFTEYTEVLQTIFKHFGTKAVFIDGSVTGTKRDAAVEAFQTNPEITVLVGNVKAAGVGITLTASSMVVFNDRPWTPALVEQAEDRTNRIGQTKPVTCYHMTAYGTYDEALMVALEGKQAVISSWEALADKDAEVARGEVSAFKAYLEARKNK